MTDDEIDAIPDHVTQESIALNAGCCGNDKWRGHLCIYHDGFRDGAEMALLRLAELERGCFPLEPLGPAG